MEAREVELGNGYFMPIVGFGTYYASAGRTRQLVEQAIDAGYRHIDTAYFFENEVEVGQAIRTKIDAGVIKREDIFVTAKLWATFNLPQHVPEAFRRSLVNLGLEYIDLYLMQSPVALPFQGYEYSDLRPEDPTPVAIEVTWRAMEQLLEGKKVRSIGVANFRKWDISRLLRDCAIRPVVNQIELHPGYVSRDMLAYCAEQGIKVMAFGPMGRFHRSTYGPHCALRDPGVVEIGRRFGKNDCQVILRYLIQLGACPLPYSTREERIIQNYQVFDFELTAADMEYMGTFHSLAVLPFHAFNDVRNIVQYYPEDVDY